MVRSLNVVALTGKAVEAPELRTFESGAEILTIRLVFWTSRKKGGAWEDAANFINVKMLKPNRKFADLIHKGTPLAVQGHLEMEEWEDKKTGEKRSKFVLLADPFGVTFSGPKPETEVPTEKQSLAPIDGFQGNTVPLGDVPSDFTPF